MFMSDGNKYFEWVPTPANTAPPDKLVNAILTELDAMAPSPRRERHLHDTGLRRVAAGTNRGARAPTRLQRGDAPLRDRRRARWTRGDAKRLRVVRGVK